MINISFIVKYFVFFKNSGCSVSVDRGNESLNDNWYWMLMLVFYRILVIVRPSYAWVILSICLVLSKNNRLYHSLVNTLIITNTSLQFFFYIDKSKPIPASGLIFLKSLWENLEVMLLWYFRPGIALHLYVQLNLGPGLNSEFKPGVEFW